MRLANAIHTVDSHTMGEATRIVVAGLPVHGKTMVKKREYLIQNRDYIRRALMMEPRGHHDMFGAIITEPEDETADLGIIFMDCGGYLNMCGHGTIGAVTMALETGMVPIKEPITEVILESPAGLIKTKAKVVDNSVEEVTFQNVPAFVFKQDYRFHVPRIGEISADIAFGGSFFAIISAKSLGTSVERKNANKLIDLGMEIRDILNKEIQVCHPEKKHINTIDLVEIYDEPSHPDADYKNAVIFGHYQIDRSPCGTGTCAKLATLYNRGQIKLNEDFTYESILGTLFQGRIVGETKVGDFEAIVPEITGSAFITGFNQYILDPKDPFKYGFTLR